MENTGCVNPFRLIKPLVRRIVRLSVYLLIVGVFITANLGSLTPISAFAKGPPDWVADELIVGFRPGVSKAKGKAIYRAQGATFIEEIPRIKTHIIRVPSHALEKVQRALSRRSEVEYVEKNRVLKPDLIPNDHYYPSQWHLSKILAPHAWEVTTGSSDVIIAILDSGVDESHPDLAGKLVAGYNFVDDNTDTSDVYGHGTAVAGAAAAYSNNGTGVAAPAFESLIMPIRVSDASGYATITTVSKGLTWAVDNGARVMNLSFGGVAASKTINNAAQYVMNHGGLVVAAAGNCACFDTIAETPYIISVSATDKNDDLAVFSSRGEYVDVSAPGLSILSTIKGGGYSSVSGTSFASPITAGVVALMWAVNPELTPFEIRDLLEGTTVDLGDPGYDTSFGFGRLNAYEAVMAAIDYTGTPDSEPPNIAISSPADGAVVSKAVYINVSASDNVGVVKVELYIDDAPFATDSHEPFSFTWDTTRMTDGSHSLHAIAYDVAGNSSASEILSLSVDNSGLDATPPEVIIAAPADGSTVSGTISIDAIASDNVGVFAVEFYLDGSLFRMDSTEPFSHTWDTTQISDGTYNLQAIAYDAAGNSQASPISHVTVENSMPDVTPPSVFVSSPTIGETVSGTIDVIVSASDDMGVTEVQLFVDGTLLASDVSEPFSFRWDTKKSNNGGHGIMANAYDAAGNVAASAEVIVTVENVETDISAPDVVVTSPYDGSTISKPVKIGVQATDNQGIGRVEVFLDGGLLQSASCSSRSCSLRFNWNPKKYGKGWHTLSASAYDNAGNVGQSSQVAVNIK